METRGYWSPRKERSSGKGKGVHTKQQYNGAQAVNSPDAYANGEKLANMKQLRAQIAAVSKALTELEASEDKELMQPLESLLTDLKARLHGTRPIGQQVDGLRGVTSRCQKRLAEAEIAKAEAEATIIKGTEDMASYRTQLAELEPLLTTSTGFRRADEPNNGMPEWVASTLSSIATHTLESSTIDRQRGCRSITSRVDGTNPSSCTSRRTAEWSIEQHYRHVRCSEPWEQARRMCRLATKHEQSETHNENDGRRNAATRRYQDPQTERNVRLLIASINVTSAVSGSGAAKERTYETGGLNMTYG